MSENTLKNRTHEQKAKLDELGRQFLLALFSGLRTAQFHKSDNKAFDEPIRILNLTSNELVALEGKADFRLLDDQFFLNGSWIKPAYKDRENIFKLVEHLQKQALGGIMIRSVMSPESWRTFFEAVRSVHAPPEHRVEELNRELTRRGIEQVEVLEVLRIIDEAEIDLPLPPAVYTAVKSYTKCLVALREFVFSHEGEEQVGALRKAQRAICDLIDVQDKHPKISCLLGLLRNVESYFYHHCVNVTIWSLLIGKSAGVGRKELVDLGMATLFHDVGKLKIPEETLLKPGPLSPQEWEIVRRHPIESSSTFLQLGYINESVGERVLVGYQHHWASKNPKAYPKPRRTMVPSLLSEIASLTITYDAFCAHRAFRRGFSPFHVMRILYGQNQRGMFRTDLVKTFASLLGPIPVGTWIQIDETEQKGLVAVSGSFADKPPYPIVFIPTAKENRYLDTSLPLPGTNKPPKLKVIQVSAQEHQATFGMLLKTSAEIY